MFRESFANSLTYARIEMAKLTVWSILVLLCCMVLNERYFCAFWCFSLLFSFSRLKCIKPFEIENCKFLMGDFFFLVLWHFNKSKRIFVFECDYFQRLIIFLVLYSMCTNLQQKLKTKKPRKHHERFSYLSLALVVSLFLLLKRYQYDEMNTLSNMRGI